MSKIGKKPLTIPEGVTVSFADNVMTVKGPKGELTQEVVEGVNLEVADGEATVSVASEEMGNYWGLYRTLLANMVEGVVNGYEKKLQLLGVGYNAVMKGTDMELSLGLSHKVDVKVPAGLKAAIDKDPKGNPIISIEGIYKQLVGEFAASVRALRTPEPYKGKGIRYLGEYVKIKPGKAAK